jgi:uncharacterized protein (TIGR03435 family)
MTLTRNPIYKRMIRAAGASPIVLAACGVFGQSAAPPAYEVASVKPNLTGRAGGEGSQREDVASSPGSLTMRNVSLRSCIRWAYGVRDFQVSGPAWLASERFDIAAKPPSPASDGQLRLMLQTLLADRFQMTLHRETRELPVYALVAGKKGPRLQPAAGEGASSMRPDGGSLVFRNFTLRELADRLSTRPFSVDRPVLDKTELKGPFDFTVNLAANAAELKSTLEGMERNQSDFALFVEQLGLKLQPQKGPVEMLVIDRAEKVPIEN